MKKDKVAIFGATGFVGQHLCKYLEKKNYRIILFVRKSSTNKFSNNNNQNIELHYIKDLYYKSDFSKPLKDAKYIINLAAKAHVIEKNIKNKKKYISRLTNIEKNIILNLKDSNIKFIQVSSAKAENFKLINKKKSDYISIYGEAKNNSEKIIRKMLDNYIILRPPLIYGPGVKANFLALIKVLDYRLPLPFLGLNNKRSYLYIDNFCNLISKILENNNIKNKTYNVSDGTVLSTLELCKYIAKFLDKKPIFFYLNKKIIRLIFFCIGKNNLYDKVFGNFEIKDNKLKKDFNWIPPYNFKMGIKNTCFWYKRRFNIKKRN